MNYNIKHSLTDSVNSFVIECVLFIICAVAIGLSPNNNNYFAYVFVTFYIGSFLCIWYGNGRRLSPFILFYITIGLFLGGRFFGQLYFNDNELFELSWYSHISLSYTDKIELMYYLCGMLGVLSIGYIYIYSKHPTPIVTNTKTSKYKIEKVITIGFYILSPIVVYSRIQSYLQVASEGYVSLYLSNQVDEYSSGSSLFNILFIILLGLSFGFGNKKLQIKYICVYSFNALISILMGSRGSFGALLLYLIWIYSLYYKVSLKKIACLGCISLCILLLVFNLSIRAQSSSESSFQSSPLDLIATFISGQGISLMVFEASRQIPSYPALGYIQSIIPGSSYIWQMISGDRIQSYDNNLSNYMCYNLNPSLYNDGYGLGWSIMSDFYLFGGRNYIGYLILCLLFGLLIAKLEIRSTVSLWNRSLLFSITPAILTLPRASFNQFFTLIIYCLVFYFLLQILIRNRHT